MSASTPFTERKYLVPFIFVTSLFMLWGIAITMGDVLNKHFQNVLIISPSESALVQFSIFGAYAVMGIPAGLFMKRFGYKNGAIFGLLLYAIGALLFIPSANAGSFLFFRISLFILACGLATLETVAHPFVAAMGHQKTSDQRINFAQAFNGLGTVIGPLLGGYFILRDTAQQGNLDTVKVLYTVIGSVILLVAVAFFFVRVPALQAHHGDTTVEENGQTVGDKKLWQQKHFVWAAITQFFNVAAQGGTWAFFINYGSQKQGLSDEQASYYFAISMVMMMAGRFLGTFLMRYIQPNKLLAFAAFMNIIMCIIVAQNFGWVSFGALMMLNFFFSIMFPTIFSLGLKNLGRYTEQASSFIVMGVVGGAVFPWFMGLVANRDVAAAYYLPIICYVVIMMFGLRLYKTK
jgi:MFS transporter, FHS family, L-fucose permease